VERNNNNSEDVEGNEQCSSNVRGSSSEVDQM